MKLKRITTLWNGASMISKPLLLLTFLCTLISASLPGVAFSIDSFTTLRLFGGLRGKWPMGSLVQAADGNLYGTTNQGGTYHSGTVFRAKLWGQITAIYNFCEGGGGGHPSCPDGAHPKAGLTIGTDGDLYGTTTVGGIYRQGTIFKISTDGTFTTLYSFGQQTVDGANPQSSLIQATDGNFYGITNLGGLNGSGTIFQMTPAGTVTILHYFCSQDGCADGSQPTNNLIQANDGNFYGTTPNSLGRIPGGTLYQMLPGGTLTTLYTFCSQPNCIDGKNPSGGLIQASDGNLYGVTAGDSFQGVSGTVYQTNLVGTLTTLYTFCSQANCADGDIPYGSLIQATDGNLYGVTTGGGAFGLGTIYRLTLSGTLTTLYSFCSQANCADGEGPLFGLMQAANGNFYGTTVQGGSSGGAGTFYRFHTSLVK